MEERPYCGKGRRSAVRRANRRRIVWQTGIVKLSYYIFLANRDCVPFA